jgi:hypothetical protein
VIGGGDFGQKAGLDVIYTVGGIVLTTAILSFF